MKTKERCPYDPKDPQVVSSIDRDSYVKVGHVLDCFEGMDLNDDITFQAICMIEWALAKRSLSKSEVKRLIENPDQDVFMPAT